MQFFLFKTTQHICKPAESLQIAPVLLPSCFDPWVLSGGERAVLHFKHFLLGLSCALTCPFTVHEEGEQNKYAISCCIRVDLQQEITLSLTLNQSNLSAFAKQFHPFIKLYGATSQSKLNIFSCCLVNCFIKSVNMMNICLKMGNRFLFYMVPGSIFNSIQCIYRALTS